MPTPDAYRSARCLLGLTQHQVGKMMRVRRETIGQIESVNPTKTRTWEAYLRYYDVWLREYARRKHPDILFAVDAILDSNDTVTRWLDAPEEPKVISGRAHAIRIVELNMDFQTISDAARYLIANGYSQAMPKTVVTKISQIVNRRVKHNTVYGFHFESL